MDITNTFKSEVFKPLVSIVIPGAIAVAPFILLLNFHFPVIETYREKYQAAYYVITSISVIGAGFLLGDIGSYVELIIDLILKRFYPKATDDWHAFLRLDSKNQTIAYGYLRDTVLHLRFELALAMSLIPFYFGMSLLARQTRWFGEDFTYWLTTCVTIAFLFLLFAAFTSAVVLIKTRRTILAGN